MCGICHTPQGCGICCHVLSEQPANRFNEVITMRKGILSLENLDQPAEGNQLVEVDPNLVNGVDEHVGGVEERIAEVDSAISDIQAGESGVEEASAVVNTLDAIGDEIGETIPEGGMGEAETRRLNVAVEHLYNQVKLPISRRIAMKVSTESFTTRESRIIATQEAYDEIKKNAIDIGVRIFEAIKKMIAAAGETLDQMTSVTELMRGRANKLVRAAHALHGKSAEAGKEIKLKANAGILLINGKMPQGDQLISAFHKHTESKAVKHDYFKAWESIKKKIAAVEAGNGAADDLGLIALELTSITGGRLTEVDGEMRASTSLEFGNQELLFSYPKDQMAQIKVTIDGPGVEGNEDATFAPLTVEQCSALAGAIEKHLAIYKGTPGLVAQAINGLSSLNHSLGAKVSPEGMEKSWTTLVQAGRAATFGAGIAVRRYDIQVCKALLDIVAQQLSAYGTPDKVKESDSRALVPA